MIAVVVVCVPGVGEGLGDEMEDWNASLEEGYVIVGDTRSPEVLEEDVRWSAEEASELLQFVLDFVESLVQDASVAEGAGEAGVWCSDEIEENQDILGGRREMSGNIESLRKLPHHSIEFISILVLGLLQFPRQMSRTID
jgi:hypothetical protein